MQKKPDASHHPDGVPAFGASLNRNKPHKAAWIEQAFHTGQETKNMLKSYVTFDPFMPIDPMAGLKSARARGRKGGRKFALTKAQVRMAQAAMASRDTSVSELCKELGVTPVTLYRYVDPNGNLRDHGKRVLSA